MALGAMELQTRVAKIAEQNKEAGFTFAFDSVVVPRDLKEYLETQQRFAEKQMQAYASRPRSSASF